MATIVRADLIMRLKYHEDSFVERKPNASDLEATVVAFANSVPVGREAIIYVGVRDNGEVIGVDNADSAQKKIRKTCQDKCYPPVHFTTEILPMKDGKVILAVVIPPSMEKPHFTGAAYIREGSESVKATPELYNDLITSRHTKAGELLCYKKQPVTLFTRKRELGRPEFAAVVQGTSHRGPPREEQCRVLRVTPFYVMLEVTGSGVSFSEPLRNVEMSYDNKRNQPLLIVRFDVDEA